MVVEDIARWNMPSHRSPACYEREIEELKAKVDRLRTMIDTICGPPLTQEEAEKAFADAPSVPLPPSRIAEMVAYATDPSNMTADVALSRMIRAAKGVAGFPPRPLAEAEAVLRKGMCFDGPEVRS